MRKRRKIRLKEKTRRDEMRQQSETSRNEMRHSETKPVETRRRKASAV